MRCPLEVRQGQPIAHLPLSRSDTRIKNDATSNKVCATAKQTHQQFYRSGKDDRNSAELKPCSKDVAEQKALLMLSLILIKEELADWSVFRKLSR